MKHVWVDLLIWCIIFVVYLISLGFAYKKHKNNYYIKKTYDDSPYVVTLIFIIVIFTLGLIFIIDYFNAGGLA